MGLFAGTQWDIPAHCDRCGKREAECQCLPEPPPRKLPAEQSLRVRVEKRKAGRVVTLVSGFEGSPVERAELLTSLKNVCGAGGSQEETTLVIQGDHVQRLSHLLEQQGYRLKR